MIFLKIIGKRIGVIRGFFLEVIFSFGFWYERKRGLNRSGGKGERRKMGSKLRVVINIIYIRVRI